MSNQFNFFITFYQCEKLKSITFLNKMSSIPNSFFYGCKSLERIKFPKNIKTIEAGAFNDCPSLKNITIPSTVTHFSFSNNQYIQSVVIEEGITSIAEGTFGDCKSLIKVTLPNSIVHIGKRAFAYCYSLGNINIPHNVRKIDSFAFLASNITTITLEGTIPPELDSTFSLENKIKKIYVPANSVLAYKTANKWNKYADIIEAKP